jgi:hypothetical protein
MGLFSRHGVPSRAFGAFLAFKELSGLERLPGVQQARWRLPNRGQFADSLRRNRRCQWFWLSMTSHPFSVPSAGAHAGETPPHLLGAPIRARGRGGIHPDRRAHPRRDERRSGDLRQGGPCRFSVRPRFGQSRRGRSVSAVPAEGVLSIASTKLPRTAASNWSAANASRGSCEPKGPGSVRSCRTPIASVQTARALPFLCMR